MQVLQAANTGITSLQSLVDSAKSIANQALQTTVGYTTKSNVSATIAGATSSDLRGTTTYTSASAISNVVPNGTAGGASPITSATLLGGVAAALVGTASLAGDGTAKLASTLLLTGTASATDLTAAAAPKDGDVLVVNGKTITFKAGAAPAAAAVPTGSGVSGNIVTDGSGNSSVYLGAGTLADVLTAVDLASGVAKTVNTAGAAVITGSTSSINAGTGVLTLNTSTGADLSITGKADLLKELGLTTSVGSGNVNVVKARTTAATTTANLIQDGSTLNVNGHTITFSNAHVPAAAQVPTGSGILNAVQTDGNGNSIVYLQTATIADTLNAIDLASGVQTASNSAGVAAFTAATGVAASSVNANGTLKLSTGTVADLSISGGTGNALAVLGLNGPTGNSSSFNAARTAGVGGINGKTLTFTSFNLGTAVNVTFGDGTGGTVKTLDQLNATLQANNLAATLELDRQTDDLGHQRLRLLDPWVGVGGRHDRRHGYQLTVVLERFGSRGRCPGAGCSQQPGDPVQQHPRPDHHHVAGCFVQRRQPVGRRHAEADVQRNRQVDPEHHRRELQCGGPRSGEPDQRRRLH